MKSSLSMKHLSDLQLLEKTRALVQEERKITLEVLEYLAEIETRKLYFSPQCTSLFEYCVSGLGYTESSAMRRIDAMRLLKKVPEVAAQVAAGELKLSQLAQVQTFLKTESKVAKKAYSGSETLEILASVKGQSTRRTEQILLEKSPAMQARRATSESQRVIAPTLTEIKIVADEELVALMAKARAKLGHSNPSMAEVIKKALRVLLKTSDSSTKLTVARPNPGTPLPAPEVPPVLNSSVADESGKSDDLEISPFQTPKSRYIPVALKRTLLERAGYLCEFEGCTSGYALEFHHLDPYAYGGAHSPENLVVYCRAHHRAV